MNHQDFKSRPGFLYRTGERYYYLGKWICLECTDYEVTDSLYMYELAYKEHNLSDLNVYFQKIRAYSDFALVPPQTCQSADVDLRYALHSDYRGGDPAPGRLRPC